MKELITRADDFGSSHSANLAIKKTVESGLVKNVSVMAVCEFVEEAAAMLAGRKDICFGLHATINSEWDHTRWAPITKNPSLMDPDGYCFKDPSMFLNRLPVLEEIIEEVEAQYEKLLKIGFKIDYMDTHMLFERYVPGLQQELNRWAKLKGLRNCNDYLCNPFPFMDYQSGTPGLFEKTLEKLESGQYIYVAHPAIYSDEMVGTGNAEMPGEVIAFKRQQDTDFLSDPATRLLCEQYGVTPVRVTEANPCRSEKRQ